jgi:thioredoxin reductase (NADPH)
VVFVIERDPTALRELLRDLTRRFGNDFTVSGENSPEAALAALHEMATAAVPVALLLVDAGSCDLLDCAHELHPHAKRVLLIDRDYSSTSPAVHAVAMGRADFHLVRPWADDEVMYRAMSEYLSSWTQEQDPSFELFRLIADENDTRAAAVRDAVSRLSLPFRFYPLGSESATRLLQEAGLDHCDLPVVIRYDGCVTVNPTLSDMARAFGVNVANHVEACDVVIVGAGPAGLTAAGDVRNGSIKRVASAVGEGASVVRLIHDYLPTVQTEREPAGFSTG